MQQQRPHHGGSIPFPTHGCGGSGSKETHHHCNPQQHQFPRPPGAPLAPWSDDMPPRAEAAASADGGATSSSSSSVKPGCMIELARIAKIPPPVSGLVCPRCESTDTKFCYYNNYSLSQPRHFCKACRRYWTRGGAIRDIPLASSIRRRASKPSNKNGTSKVASSSGAGRTSSSSSSSGGATVPRGRVAVAMAAATTTLPPLPPLQMAPLDLDLLCAEQRANSGPSRLWFPGHSSQDPMDYQLGSRRGAVSATAIRLEQQYCCYLPQLSFFSYRNGVMAPTTSPAISPFRAEGGTEAAGSFAGEMKAVPWSMVPGSSPSSVMTAANQPSTKMGALTTSPTRPFLGLQGDDELRCILGSGSWSWTCGYYGGTASRSGSSVAPGNVWAEDLSGFTSSTSWNVL